MASSTFIFIPGAYERCEGYVLALYAPSHHMDYLATHLPTCMSAHPHYWWCHAVDKSVMIRLRKLHVHVLNQSNSLGSIPLLNLHVFLKTLGLQNSFLIYTRGKINFQELV